MYTFASSELQVGSPAGDPPVSGETRHQNLQEGVNDNPPLRLQADTSQPGIRQVESSFIIAGDPLPQPGRQSAVVKILRMEDKLKIISDG